MKVAVVSAEAAREDLRMFGVSSSGGLFRDHSELPRTTGIGLRTPFDMAKANIEKPFCTGRGLVGTACRLQLGWNV